MNEGLKVIISADIKKLKKSIKEGKSLISKFSEEGQEAFEAFNDEVQKVGDASKKFLGMAAGAITGAATALLALGASTKDYREAQAKLTTAFQAAGGSAEDAKKTYNDLYRVLGDTEQATEATQLLAQLTTNQKDLGEWTNICQGVYATFGDALPIESLAEAANETAKTGEITGALADALNWAGINEDDFAESLFWCNNEAEREKLIRDTLNDVYSDAAGIYEENNAQILAQNEAQAKMTEAMALVGEAVAPINTALTELGAEVLAQLAPYITEFAEKHLPGIADALSGVGTAIGEVMKWIADNWELVSTLATIVLAIAAALTVFSTVMGIVNAVMTASPITWIVLAIVAALAALVAIIVVVIKNWENIKAATMNVWNAIVNFLGGIFEKIKNAFAGAFSWINDKIITPIKNLPNSIKNIFNNVVNGIKEKLNLAKTTVKNIIDSIKGFFKFEWSLPKLKVPKFAITPSGWQIGDLLQGVIPKLGITWNARGGVFDKPALFNYGNSLQGLGENGAEAVVPLENNLEWLDKLATMLSQRMGSTPIVLQVDGKTFAKTSINTINQLTRQSGKLGLVIT